MTDHSPTQPCDDAPTTPDEATGEVAGDGVDLSGPWTVESVDLLMGLGGEFGTDEADKGWFEWSTPMRLAGMDLWLWNLANEDPTPEDPDRWTWHTEVHTSRDLDASRMLASHVSHSRVEAVDLARGLLNASEYLRIAA